MFAGKKSAQIREILISESAWEEMTCLFAPSLNVDKVKMISGKNNFISVRDGMAKMYPYVVEELARLEQKK